jgi:hypothetical protein
MTMLTATASAARLTTAVGTRTLDKREHSQRKVN